MLHTKYKWMGLSVVMIVIAIDLVAAVLVFSDNITVENAYAIAKWGFFPALVGFVLHMIVVLQQWKEKRQNKIATD
ncbi:MAG: hypothetical protein OES09_15760 [Gammaproteobacteria bacterium]|nr:hypothetical protein [Gammaproteobacteria bacterium]